MNTHKIAIGILILFALAGVAGWALTPSLSTVATMVLTTDARSAAGARDDHILRTIARITSGTATNQADVTWHDSRTLASGAVDSLSLRALTDSFGGAVLVGHIKALMLENTGTSTLTIGSGSRPITSVWSGTTTLPPGAAVFILEPATGWATSSGTADVLTVTNGTGTGTYDIALAGTSI